MPHITQPRVFVLDKHKKPLMPCTPGRARELLRGGKAVIHRRYPFVIRLKERIGGDVQPVRVCIDPGSVTTGLAIVREENSADEAITAPIRYVLFKAELTHRGWQIKKAMEQRKNYRKRRRSMNLRHREPRFNNRTRAEGWLPPSLKHRVDGIKSWVDRFRRYCPVSAISMELVRFDTQKMQNPEISGVEYQQGDVAGYEVREYLLEKWGRKCAYCDKEGVPLQVEHIQPRAKGGSNRISNLTLACEKCNKKKGTQDIAMFLKKDPAKLRKIQSRQKVCLKDAAAVNVTKNALRRKLESTELPVETSSGAVTKWNRHRFNVPKTHANDAICIGNISDVRGWEISSIGIVSMGRGQYRRTLVNEFGFKKAYMSREKTVFKFRTGDIVRAVIAKGNKKGIYTGRIAIRSTGKFNIKTKDALIEGIGHKHFKFLQKGDGYRYSAQNI